MHEDERLKVLLVNDHLGYEGRILHGVARLFLHWAPGLEETGCSVTVCVLRGRDALARRFEERGIDIRFLGRARFDPLTAWDLVRLVREEEVDVIHAQGYGGRNFGRIAGVVTGTPVVSHIHDASSYYPWYQWIADGLLNWADDATLAVSRRVKDNFFTNRNSLGRAEDEVAVLYSCVDVETFCQGTAADAEHVKRELGIEPGGPVVGTVSRLDRHKGNEYLVEAAALLEEERPGVTTVVVGDGPDRGKLEGLAREKGLGERVLFTGFRDDVPRVLSAFDVMVIASVSEGFPLTAVEAMAAGKAIVATDVVEVIEDGVTGLVVPAEDPGALKSAVARLLEDEDLRARLGERAKSRSRGFGVGSYTERLRRIYRGVVSGRSHVGAGDDPIPGDPG